MSVKVLQSSKGGLKIEHAGFVYNLNNNIDDTYYWKCEEYKSSNCYGRLVTVLNQDNIHKIKKNTDIHSHEPDVNRRFVLQAINNIENSANQTRESASKIIRGEKRKLTSSTICDLPSDSALLQIIKRQRKEIHGNENISGASFKIPFHCKKLNNKRFFIGEYKDEAKRAIVFAYKETIEVLCNAKMIIMDGTFKITPSGFTQLYTIHATVLVKGIFVIIYLQNFKYPIDRSQKDKLKIL